MGYSNKHDASGQLTGYLYQILSALLLLVENDDPESQLCIEKFDDITIEDNDGEENCTSMTQVKHHIHPNKAGKLSSTSSDFWRTINSWCDYIKNYTTHKKTKFIIITTASSKDGSTASYLRQSPRDWEKALDIMLGIASEKEQKNNISFYNNFESLDKSQREYLVKNTYIYDKAPVITGIKKEIMRYVRMSTPPAHEESAYDKIIGWWMNHTITCLTSEDPIFISYRQLQNEMIDIGSKYRADNLPIDVDPFYFPTENEIAQLDPEKRIFIRQLELIFLSSNQLKRCIRDYYNAYCQRSKWVREELLFINDLDEYQKKLIDEWNRCFEIMKEDLEDKCGDEEITENKKQSAGRSLFHKIEELNVPIKPKVIEPFIIRGTYHELANQLKVGWHVDFLKHLSGLLTTP